MTETEKEEKNKAAYLDLPNFWLTSRPWLMLAFIGAFIFCQLLVFKHGFPESRKLFKTPIFERWGKQICLNE